MRTILVTGAAGFIGSHLADRLLERGDRVCGFDNFDSYYPRAYKEQNIAQARTRSDYSLVEGDIRDKNAVLDVFNEFQPDVVVHLAACAGVRASFQDPDTYYQVNVIGTQHVLDACLQTAPSHLVAASSSSVYGARTTTPFREDDPGALAISPYAASKAMNEHMAHIYHRARGLNATMVRIFTAYGPRQRPDMGIYRFTRFIEEGTRIPMYGDGTTRRDYTYIDDVVDGFVRCIDRPLPFEIINIGSEFSISLADLIQTISDAVGKPARVEHLPMQEGDVELTTACVRKAHRLLGYEPQIDVAEGVKRFVDWYRTNRLTAPARNVVGMNR